MKKPDYLSYSPWPSSSSLSRRLERSFNVTKTIIDALLPGQQAVARLPGLNPPYWEFGHLTWFHEFWVHRWVNPANPSFIKQADALFNSSVIAHADRYKEEQVQAQGEASEDDRAATKPDATESGTATNRSTKILH